MSAFTTGRWARAWGGPAVAGRIRAKPEHFRVTETLNHAPDGSGEHIYVHVEKRGANTRWVADRLAAHCGVKPRDVGFAGMKDRDAVTRQWFSVGLAGRDEPEWERLSDAHIRVLQVVRHGRKLRRGAIGSNRFDLVITEVAGDASRLQAQLGRIANDGVPNYFGEQRFGRDGGNIDQALALFSGRRCSRPRRSIYLSAARAWLFNELLGLRVADNTWRRVFAEDVMMLAGTHSIFAAPAAEREELQLRLDRHEIEVTGPLAGTGQGLTANEPGRMEQQVFDDNPRLYQGLFDADVAAARRALCVVPQALAWQLDGDRLSLSFDLPAGAYATAVLREIIDYSHGEHGK